LKPVRLQGIQEYPVRLPLTHHSVYTPQNNTSNDLKASDRVLRLLLLLEEYGVTFEYLPGKKNVGTVADVLSRFDIYSLKIQEEEVLTLLSGSENNRISNIKSTIPMRTSLIFKEQTESRNQDYKKMA
jgi:hypothetical protein